MLELKLILHMFLGVQIRECKVITTKAREDVVYALWSNN